MAPALRLEQQGKSRIAANVDPLDRVHLNSDFQAHPSACPLAMPLHQALRDLCPAGHGDRVRTAA